MKPDKLAEIHRASVAHLAELLDQKARAEAALHAHVSQAADAAVRAAPGAERQEIQARADRERLALLQRARDADLAFRIACEMAERLGLLADLNSHPELELRSRPPRQDIELTIGWPRG